MVEQESKGIIKLESVETEDSLALSLHGMNNVHCCDSFSVAMFSVSDGVSDELLHEVDEHFSRVLVDLVGDSFDSSSSSESSNGSLCDSLNQRLG